MPSARYWRVVAFDTVGLADLALSEFALYEAGVRVDSAGMLTASIAPSSGNASDLSDGSNAAVVRWPRTSYATGGFALTFDLGSAKSVDEIRIGSGSLQSEFVCKFDLQWSTTGITWSTAAGPALGVIWPGANSTATISGDLSLLSALSAMFSFDGANGSTTLADKSAWAKPMTVSGGMQISTARSKFGGSSLLVDGSSGIATTPISNAIRKSMSLMGDFTIHFWAWKSADGGFANDTVCGAYPVGSGVGWMVLLSATYN